MSVKPKVGIFFLTAGWFREIGLQDNSSELSNEIEEVADDIVKKINEFADTVYSGIIFSEESARNASVSIKKEDIDLAII